MTDELNADNKAPIQGDNKPTEAKEPNLPGQEVKDQEPQDPELQKWIDETKDLPNAYKRVKGSESEVKKYREQLEQKDKEQQAFQAQLAQELRAVYEKDPETASKLFGMPPEKKSEPQKGIPAQPQVDAGEIARQVQAQLEVTRFYENNQGRIDNEEDWAEMQSLALGFVGKRDRTGKPYTIQSALRDAMVLRHPNLISDKAVMEHLTSSAKRASASETGSVPSGSASDENLEGYDDLAQEMGINLSPESRKRLAEKKKKRKAT